MSDMRTDGVRLHGRATWQVFRRLLKASSSKRRIVKTFKTHRSRLVPFHPSRFYNYGKMSSTKQTLSLEEEDKAPLGRERSITLSQAQFEELYLQPFKMSKMQERNAMTFGNPTLLGLLSFCCTFTPTCCSLMSFGGSTPSTMTAYM